MLYKKIDDACLQNIFVATFDDITEDLLSPYQKSYSNLKLPSENDISGIISWVREKMLENNNQFIVHCTGGISRSSAVAVLVEYIIHRDADRAMKVVNPMLHSPNGRVLQIGEKLLGTNEIKEPIMKKINDYDLANKGDIGNTFNKNQVI